MNKASKTTDRIGLRRKPVRRDAEATHLSIVEATHKILSESGLDQLTTKRIAERARISQGTLYQYFSNKESILYFIAEERIKRLWNAIKKCDVAEANATHLIVWLEGFIDAVWNVMGSEPEVTRRIEVISTMPEIRELYRQHGLRSNAFIIRNLRYFAPATEEEVLVTVSEFLRASVTGVMVRAVDLRPIEAQRILALLKQSMTTVVYNTLVHA